MVLYVLFQYRELFIRRKNSPPVLEKEFELETSSDRPKGKLTWKSICNRDLVYFALLMCFRTIVDNGVGSWMPTILFEVYGVSSTYSSLLSVVRLVISLLGIALGAFVYARSKGDELHSILILMVPLLPIILILNYLSILSIAMVLVLLFGATLLLAVIRAVDNYGSYPQPIHIFLGLIHIFMIVFRSVHMLQ